MRVCVFVETFEIFTYICAGRQLSNNLIMHLPQRHPLCVILSKSRSEILNWYQELVFLKKKIYNGKEYINTTWRTFRELC